MKQSDTIGDTILIVDDEALNRLLLKKTLELAGYSPIEARDGKEALDKIAEDPPDLIVLDVMMPGLTGFDVCSTLKQNPETHKIPVILLTALNKLEDIEKGVTAGADEFISKPFNEKELLIRIRELLKIKAFDTYVAEDQILFSILKDLDRKGQEEYCGMRGNVERILYNELEQNLRINDAERDKPAGAYLRLETDLLSIPPTYLSFEEGKAVRKELSFIPGAEQLAPFGIEREGILMSNWQHAFADQKEYERLLPAPLVEAAGSVHNFLFYEDTQLTVLFFNFGRTIRPFDLSWVRHLINFTKILLSTLEQMLKHEMEYTELSESLSRITEIKDDAPLRHKRLKEICRILCEEMKCSHGFSLLLQDAMNIFDMWKLLIDQTILMKEAPLNDDEMKTIYNMPKQTLSCLGETPRLAFVKEILENTNEHYDGSGLPLGKRGEEIPLSARIATIANVYAALRMKRSFRSAMSHEEAMRTITEGNGRLRPSYFDPRLLDALIQRQGEIRKLYEE
jgi:response regulator RpfG family c-di-GMP phosphodiesterase